MIKAALTTAAALALVAGLAGTTPAHAAQEKVEICHFPGHESRGTSGPIVEGTPDYVIQGEGLACEEAGGTVITVAEVAAVRGHKATDLPNGDPLELN